MTWAAAGVLDVFVYVPCTVGRVVDGYGGADLSLRSSLLLVRRVTGRGRSVIATSALIVHAMRVKRQNCALHYA